MLAFIRGGETFLTSDQIYVKMLPNGEPRKVTDDNRSKYGLAFSPDGSETCLHGHRGSRVLDLPGVRPGRRATTLHAERRRAGMARPSNGCSSPRLPQEFIWEWSLQPRLARTYDKFIHLRTSEVWLITSSPLSRPSVGSDCGDEWGRPLGSLPSRFAGKRARNKNRWSTRCVHLSWLVAGWALDVFHC